MRALARAGGMSRGRGGQESAGEVVPWGWGRVGWWEQGGALTPLPSPPRTGEEGEKEAGGGGDDSGA